MRILPGWAKRIVAGPPEANLSECTDHIQLRNFAAAALDRGTRFASTASPIP